jgi:hypothetical protein
VKVRASYICIASPVAIDLSLSALPDCLKGTEAEPAGMPYPDSGTMTI